MRAILTYHSIDSSGSPVSVSEETFRAHARFLGSGRVSVGPLADLPSLPDEEDAVALTFDDGFLNFSMLAMPLLSDPTPSFPRGVVWRSSDPPSKPPIAPAR